MTATANGFIPSKYQSAIFDWISAGRGDAIVNAVAGSGKTTTLVQAAKLLHSRDAIFCAFNSHIAKELGAKLNGQMECKTIHSLGFASLTRHLGSNGKKIEVDGSKYSKLVRREARDLANEVMTVKEGDIRSCLDDLVNFSQVTLTDPAGYPVNTDWLEMIDRYSITIPPGLKIEDLAKITSRILCDGEAQAKEEKVISFTDMIWLPNFWNLELRKAQWVFVDECQDLSRAQLELVLKLRAKGGRMIFVGDPRQAIYGFAGADAQSYWNIAERTGAAEFPLSVCYRCPVLVIRKAQEIVRQIEPAPNHELGTVRSIKESKLSSEIREGDLILCRLTAPLISTCLSLIAQKVPARVRGRDIGKQLTATVKAISELIGFEFEKFPEFLSSYIEKQIKKLANKDGSEAQIEALCDKRDALQVCFENIQADSIEQFTEEIESLFDDSKPGVWLSTIHKAKGLEESRVFILKPQRLPLIWKNQQEWELQQEYNLKYVAITRAMSELVYVEE